MIINLKHEALTAKSHSLTLNLSERLPENFADPCKMIVEYSVQSFDSLYLLKLKTEGEVKLECQRCLEVFSYFYKNDTLLAVCNTEKEAEKYLESYETIVAENDLLNLNDVVTDDLHLFVPMSHPSSEDCNIDMAKYINISQ